MAGMRRPRRASAPLAAALAALALALVAPAAASGEAVVGSAAASAARAAALEYSIDLYEDGDFASQATIYWCVGASMQMMMNLIGVTEADASRDGQERYMRLARGLGPSLDEVDDGQSDGILRGAGSSGWARGLTELGAGRYEERALDGFDAAVRAAAIALRETNRPVGLIVWRGAHAWVMTGFTATADPLIDPDFGVTGVFVLDSWYPRVSRIWGPGQTPNTLLSTSELAADFLPRRGGRWHADLAGKFVVVIPVAPVRLTTPRRLAH